jgi:signal peptide peptidase SppA
VKILDVLNEPWVLPQPKLQEITQIYATHLRGEKIDIERIEAQLGEPLQNEPKAYEVRHGVAILVVDGILSKRMNLFSRISGGTSTELLGRDLRAALEDTRVGAILLNIDSPGGQVDGVQGVADQVFAARGRKPIVALGDGLMTSGAYWIGSAAQGVYIGDDTTITGSIGVATQHVDYSGMEQKAGIKTTDIYAGRYKRIASSNAPLSEEGKAYLQAIVDQIYTVFVDAVARNRGTDAETVLKDMADGRLFVGRAAVDAGLVDGVSTLDDLIADLVAGRKPARRAGAAGR